MATATRKSSKSNKTTDKPAAKATITTAEADAILLGEPAAKATGAKATKTATTPKEAPAVTPVPKEALVNYLKANVSGAADAPNQLLPFITDKDVLRVHPSHWLSYLENEKVTAAKRAALQVLKDAGLVQKVYQLPGEKRSAGFYTGPVPAGCAKLPRRIVERKQPTPKPATTAETSAAIAQDADTDPTRGPVEPALATGTTIAKVEGREIQVGDVIGTAGADTRKVVTSDEGSTVAFITTSPEGRVQARSADRKMIRSLAPDTKVWIARTA